MFSPSELWQEMTFEMYFDQDYFFYHWLVTQRKVLHRILLVIKSPVNYLQNILYSMSKLENVGLFVCPVSLYTDVNEKVLAFLRLFTAI